MNLLNYKDLINGKPIHIATVNKQNNPNLSVASDVMVIDSNTILISVNEMVNTQKNVQYNKNVVLTAFDQDYNGIRIFGTAEYFENGEYYEICEKTFFGNGEVSPFGATKPKGVLVVTVKSISEFV